MPEYLQESVEMNLSVSPNSGKRHSRAPSHSQSQLVISEQSQPSRIIESPNEQEEYEYYDEEDEGEVEEGEPLALEALVADGPDESQNVVQTTSNENFTPIETPNMLDGDEYLMQIPNMTQQQMLQMKVEEINRKSM